jgi:hypothetical protein
MIEVGFEPTKHMQQILSLPPLTTRELNQIFICRLIVAVNLETLNPVLYYTNTSCLYIVSLLMPFASFVSGTSFL